MLALWLGVLEYLIRRYTGDDLLPLIESLDLRLMEATWDTRWASVAQPGAVTVALLCITLIPLAIAVGTAIPPPAAKRALLVPAALLGASLCRDVSRMMASDGAYTLPVLAAVHIVLSVLPFVVLVAAPRIVAGATRDWRIWVPRFALFYTAWWAGALARW